MPAGALNASVWDKLSTLTMADGEPLQAPMRTLQIVGGRKEKIRAGDVICCPTGGPESAHQIINDSDNPGGTNWGSGLFMALKGFPKPDVIFFMTDGNKSDAEGWVDAVTKQNLTGGKRTVIHTTAMMEPDAAEELDQLAKRNGGNFTIVTATGFTLTSEEFFKAARKETLKSGPRKSVAG